MLRLCTRKFGPRICFIGVWDLGRCGCTFSFPHILVAWFVEIICVVAVNHLSVYIQPILTIYLVDLVVSL